MATERTYTVPLRRGFQNAPKYYRTNRAVKTLREFLMRHMKAAEENVRIGQHLNQLLWQHGIRNPPAKVTITVKKGDDGIVLAELAGKEYKDVVKPKARTEEPKSLQDRLKAAVGKKDAAEAQDAPPRDEAVPAATQDEAPKVKRPAKKAAKE